MRRSVPRARPPARAWLLAAALSASGAPAAQAIVEGHASGLGHHVVRVGGKGAVCSGVVIGRRLVVTAAHCPSVVSAGGAAIGAGARSRAAVLDDGTRIAVAGDSVILTLRAPLPASVSPVPVADAEGDGPYLIAGYGTPSEANRSYGALREALLVASNVERHMLVDPRRAGTISASACFGDSGGPVLQRGAGGWRLVGVITRANHPKRKVACGFYTRYAPVRASGTALAAAPQAEGVALATPPRTRRAREAEGKEERAAARRLLLALPRARRCALNVSRRRRLRARRTSSA